MALKLKFRSLEDFEPAKVVEQIEPLKKLMETRNKLSDLISKADRSEDLENILERVLKNTDDLKKFQTGLGVADSKPEGGA
jgi:type VI secretion system protein ImpB